MEPQHGKSIVETLQNNINVVRKAGVIAQINHPNYKLAFSDTEMANLKDVNISKNQYRIEIEQEYDFSTLPDSSAIYQKNNKNKKIKTREIVWNDGMCIPGFLLKEERKKETGPNGAYLRLHFSIFMSVRNFYKFLSWFSEQLIDAVSSAFYRPGFFKRLQKADR